MYYTNVLGTKTVQKVRTKAFSFLRQMDDNCK